MNPRHTLETDLPLTFIRLAVSPTCRMLIIVRLSSAVRSLSRPIINEYRHNVTYVQSDSHMYKPHSNYGVLVFIFNEAIAMFFVELFHGYIGNKLRWDNNFGRDL